jgi:hypothetical protein
MAGDYWEDVAYGSAPLNELRRGDPSATFDWLNAHLPAAGSKIDWPRVPGRHEGWEVHDDASLVEMTTREVSRRVKPDSVVEHIGDSLSPCAVSFTGDRAAEVVAALLEIPEHHYFLAEDRSWIVVATTEGNLDVVDR